MKSINMTKNNNEKIKSEDFFQLFLIVILAAVFMFVSMGCIKVKKKNAVENDQIQVSGQIQRIYINDFKTVYIGGRQPQSYSAVLSWPKASEQIVELRLNNELILSTAESDVTSYTFSPLRGGQIFSISIQIFDLNRNVMDENEYTFEVPLDLELSRSLVLDQNTTWKYGRIFIENETQIFTNQFNLDIHAQEILISGKALIQNFLPDTKTIKNSHGFSGGIIKIQADTIQGYLTAVLNAAPGGDSYTKPEILCPDIRSHLGDLSGDITSRRVNCSLPPGCWGENGFNAGHSGQLIIDNLDSSNFHVEIHNPIALGGQPQAGTETLPNATCTRRKVGLSSTPAKTCLRFFAYQLPCLRDELDN